MCVSVDNWALVYAQQLALEENLPLHVCFCLVPRYLEATYRQYAFMLRGLQEVAKVNISVITNLNIQLCVCVCKVRFVITVSVYDEEDAHVLL